MPLQLVTRRSQANQFILRVLVLLLATLIPYLITLISSTDPHVQFPGRVLYTEKLYKERDLANLANQQFLSQSGHRSGTQFLERPSAEYFRRCYSQWTTLR